MAGKRRDTQGTTTMDGNAAYLIVAGAALYGVVRLVAAIVSGRFGRLVAAADRGYAVRSVRDEARRRR